MNNQKPGIFMPALIGGAVAGVLSWIPFLNCLCFLWIIGGAMLASYLLSKDSPVPLRGGDGAYVGVFTGIVAAVVRTVITLPSFLRMDMSEIREKIEERAEEIPDIIEKILELPPFTLFIISFLFILIIFAALGALGGIIGISIFGKKTPASGQGANGAS